MDSRYSVHITPAEWRWVIFLGIGLVLLAFLPFVWLALSGVLGNEWQFMGVLHNYLDGATYIAKMEQGFTGRWLIQFMHTPDVHDGAFIQVIYPFLGHISRLAGVPTIVMFHVARVGASLFMYMAIYQLGASIWFRLRTRRIFFILVAAGAGFGWLFGPLSGDGIAFPDLTAPEAYPLASTYVNVHFPLSIGFLALLVAVMISAFRPGAAEDPDVRNGGLMAMLSSFMLSLLYPQALVPIGAAVSACVGISWLQQKRLPMREIRWLLMIVLPSLPMAAYYFAVVTYNPAFAAWNQQNVTSAPPVLILLLSLGLPLLIALPGIVRAVRRFEQDGDRFMLLWLAAIVVMVYLPFNIQRRFLVGVMLVIAYFATRSLEDFWFQYVSRRWRYHLLVVVISLSTVSHLFVLVLPILPLLTGNYPLVTGLILERDYRAVFDWLDEQSVSTDVVLASPNVGLWLPAWADVRPVYGHPFETLNAAERKRGVEDWYSGNTTTEACTRFLADNRVRYVVAGPEEAALGTTPCLDSLTSVAEFGLVTVYEKR